MLIDAFGLIKVEDKKMRIIIYIISPKFAGNKLWLCRMNVVSRDAQCWPMVHF